MKASQRIRQKLPAARLHSPSNPKPGCSRVFRASSSSPEPSREPWGTLRPNRICNPSSKSRSNPGAFSPSEGRWSGCILIRCPNHLRLLLSMPKKCSDSTPSSLWMSDLFTSSPRQIPTALRKKLIFTAGMPNPVLWGHCSELMSAGEGFDIDRPLLYTSFNRTCVNGNVKPQNRLLISTLHWLKNKTPIHMDFLAYGQRPILNSFPAENLGLRFWGAFKQADTSTSSAKSSR